MEGTNVLELYEEWLIDKIRFGNKTELFRGLLDLMFSMDFYYMIKQDANRAADGTDWRWIFCQETGCSLDELESCLGPKCKILEMLIGLAFKIANDVVGESYKGDRTPDWFWRFIKNLNLEGCYGDYLSLEARTSAMSKLSQWMNRDIDYDGTGGLFPLKNPPGDERETEIIYQMYAYVHENFPV